MYQSLIPGRAKEKLFFSRFPLSAVVTKVMVTTNQRLPAELENMR